MKGIVANINQCRGMVAVKTNKYMIFVIQDSSVMKAPILRDEI